MTAFVVDDGMLSWGRAHRFTHRVARPFFRDQLPGLVEDARKRDLLLLPVGFRRSYGDSCLNEGGALLDMSHLDRLIGFDPDTGLLEAEAGISLQAILEFAIPRGFFLPVVPGTQFVSLGGAIASDIHGKNHVTQGAFGNSVVEMELLRTDGSVHKLSRDTNAELFAATIGGLGLTGIVARATLRLERNCSSSILQTETRFGSLSEYFALVRENARDHAFTVAWVDCISTGRRCGRGKLLVGAYIEDGKLRVDAPRTLSLPVDLASRILHKVPMAAFNLLYRGLSQRRSSRRILYDRFFFPLDRIAGWNRVYGRDGLYQHQSVLPADTAEEAATAILREVATGDQRPFLAVLKPFGPILSPGLLSFPMEGTTIALDFANMGRPTLALLDRLDAIVRSAQGRIYAAKDGRMQGSTFRSGYPQLDRFLMQRDPGLSSSFWRRVAN